MKQKKGRSQLWPAASLTLHLSVASPKTRFAQTVWTLLPQSNTLLGIVVRV